jgi:hypothetical protein
MLKEEINMSTYKWALDERGFKEVPFKEYTEEQKKKCDYVEYYLSPSVEHSRCGWNHVVYVIMENEYGREEYAVLYPDAENSNGRYMNVSGNSLGAIAEEVWKNVFR